MQVDAADALERADHEGIGGQKPAWTLALDMPLLEAGIEPLEEGRLLRRQLDHLVGVLPLERKPALATRAEPLWLRIFCTVIADTRRTLQSQERLDPVAAIIRQEADDPMSEGPASATAAGCMSASSAIRATTSGGVLIGCDFAIGGRSLRPSSWKRRFQS